jgi:hypothetical protein
MPNSQDFLVSCVAIACLTLAAPCFAEQNSAIVEDIQVPKGTLTQFDYVGPGRVIDLGRDGTVTLGYLTSCQRERIQGGKVTIGQIQSSVEGGDIKRLKVACDGGILQLTSEQSQQALAIVFRDYDANKDKGFPKTQMIVYGIAPVVSLGKPGGMLEIRRIDLPEQPISLSLDNATLDLAKQGIALTPGGLYQAKAQGGITFKIDASAGSGGPILSRLLRF